MSAPINDGGPAFPVLPKVYSNSSTQIEAIGHIESGMTLRDWFAGQALAGDMASQSEQTGELLPDVNDMDLRARAALLYRFADAMIAARTITASQDD